MSEMSSYMNLANQLAQQNNQWSASQAAEQRNFQREMSNSSHQREVKDLQAAGLNPVLSAHSNGASTPTGAMGSTDNSNVQAMVDILKYFGEGIAQASAKGAATGSGPGTDSVIDEILHKNASAKQLWNMEQRMKKTDDKNTFNKAVYDYTHKNVPYESKFLADLDFISPIIDLVAPQNNASKKLKKAMNEYIPGRLIDAMNLFNPLWYAAKWTKTVSKGAKKIFGR